ncbi:MAG TPA: permease [Elusimicrobiota bacterium]|nr:permease [Elusimicrobiota bacterium]
MTDSSKVDPICGMNGRIPAHGKWFCSEYCVRQYESDNGLPAATVVPEARWGWIRKPIVWVAAAELVLLFLSYLLPVLGPFRHVFVMYLYKIAGPVLVGFLIGGLIDHYVPRSYVSGLMAGHGGGVLVRSTGLGFIMAACSHGILAVAIELYRKGASVPAVIAFLLASPWANLPVTILLFGFFGFKAFALIFMALVVALTTGFLFQALDRKGWIERNPNTVETSAGFSVREDMRRRWAEYPPTWSRFFREDAPGVVRGAFSLADMVLWWILLGMGLAALAGALIPPHWFHRWMSASWTGLGVTLLLATVMEICSEGTAPLAFEIYRQTGAFGNVAVYLMAGVATDYTEIGLLWSTIGRRTAFWLPALTVPQVVLWGMLFNTLF